MNKKIKTQDDFFYRHDKDYIDFFSSIKTRLRKAQIQAALAANSELVKFYWELGSDLVEKQKEQKWGTHFLEQFSHGMRQAFPEMKYPKYSCAFFPNNSFKSGTILGATCQSYFGHVP